jgi:hypothetical protein
MFKFRKPKIWKTVVRYLKRRARRYNPIILRHSSPGGLTKRRKVLFAMQLIEQAFERGYITQPQLDSYRERIAEFEQSPETLMSIVGFTRLDIEDNVVTFYPQGLHELKS